MVRRIRGGFTLVELLVVIAIIGILMGLLIPAVQYARETSRKAACANNLRQIGTAFQLHSTQWQTFPTAGAVIPGPRSLASGNGKPHQGKQPQNWGWAYQSLPYLEQENAWKIPGSAADATVAALSFPVYFCPSRRSAISLPGVNWGPDGERGQIDYAGCGGYGPAEFPDFTAIDPLAVTQPGTVVFNGPDRVGQGNILDGASGTLLVGERNWNRGRRNDTTQLDENNGYICGYDMDTIRWAFFPPAADRRDTSNGDTRFGSSHSQICQFVFADGSTHSLNFTIDPVVFQAMAGRKDKRTQDPSAL
jgi:prepilin-type N-terminal cleavage/methylation domain-containing protein